MLIDLVLSSLWGKYLALGHDACTSLRLVLGKIMASSQIFSRLALPHGLVVHNITIHK